METGKQVEDEHLPPEVGTLFNSLDEAKQCFRAYGDSTGFGVVTKSSKTENGVKYHVVYACHRSGKPRSKGSHPINPMQTGKTECNVQMCLSLKVDGKWMLNSIKLKHNHKLLEPEKTKYLSCNRSIPIYAKRTFELNAAAGIRLNKTMTSCIIEAGGPDNLSYTERDMRNLMEKVKRHKLKEGDADAMMKYFRKMQKENTDFFYSIELDENDRLKNVFWADAQSRAAYKEFGDVVTFDTTYLVNKFSMPFAPFVGVNHHGFSVLFGCGLITREDTDSFVWLFKAWLECMLDIPPKAIITDQCRAMQNAIQIVFPNARHRWCLWHIMRKIPEKFKGYEIGVYKAIKFKLKVAVYDALSSTDFEQTWEEIIKEYKLEENEWLSGLYEERNRWVPALVKDTFWAGMSTTQRSESINAFFKEYVKKSTSLQEFVEQYENALGDKVQKEKDEDFRCTNVQLGRVSPYRFEEQFREAYTLLKYAEIQEQFKQMIGCNLAVGPIVDGISVFFITHEMLVGNKHPIEKNFIYTAHYNEESYETKCNCRLFESKGLVCGHMMCVWAHKMLVNTPDAYILKRWRKNIVRSHTNVKISYANWKKKDEWHRFDKMLSVHREVAEKTMHSDAKTAIVLAKLKEASEIVDKMSDDECISSGPIISKEISCHKVVGDPAKAPRPGKPREKRIKPQSEKISEKMSKKRSKGGKPGNYVDNDISECYRPILTQESSNHQWEMSMMPDFTPDFITDTFLSNQYSSRF